MTNLKTTALAVTLAGFTASSALAGGMAAPIMTMEPEMVMEESASSSSGLLVPLILLALITVAMSQTTSSAGTPVVVGPPLANF